MEQAQIDDIAVEPTGGGIGFSVTSSRPAGGDVWETEEVAFNLTVERAVFFVAHIEQALFEKQTWDELVPTPVNRGN